jgi:hypothetical protein
MIIGWLLPNRPQESSPICVGTARQVARRFVTVLTFRDDYHKAVLEQHLVMVIHALRATGTPVTKFSVVKWALPHNLEVLHRKLYASSSDGKWLENYLDDLTRDRRELIACEQAHLSARLEVADVPSESGGTFRRAARELGGSVVDLMLGEVCTALVWTTTIAVYAAVFWIAFDDLGLAELVGRRAISLEQCLGLGLLSAVLFNALNAGTDALARRVAGRAASQL